MTAVILDTDIGTDIDDTWALAMLLNCPELDLRLVTTGTGDPTYRAGIVAGLLAAAGRDEVPIGLGVPTRLPAGAPLRSLGRFAMAAGLGRRRGAVADDGVRAMVECVMGSPEPVTIVAIGPVTNLAAALELEPAIARNARVVGMLGSIRPGYGQDAPVAEYNVAVDVEACRAVFAAPWEVTVTPLDTCGLVRLRDERYARVRAGSSPLPGAVMRTYREWYEASMAAQPGSLAEERTAVPGPLYEHASTVLYDTVAVYLAYDESLVEIEELQIDVDDDGTMRISPGAPAIRAATAWRDLDRFTDHLVDRLLVAPA